MVQIWYFCINMNIDIRICAFYLKDKNNQRSDGHEIYFKKIIIGNECRIRMHM